MATKKYLSLDRLTEYDVLIKSKIDSGDSTTLDSAKSYTDSEVSKIKSGTVVVKEAEHAGTADSATTADTATSAETANSATTAQVATKASQDGNGNVISTTYETKEDAQLKYDMIASAKADWNQNDETALDYIKNRPFYSTGEYESKELLKDFKPTALGGGVFILTTCPVLIEGQTYQVILNNEEFICVGRIDDEGSVSLGNINYKTDGWTDEHEPFSLSSLGGMGILDVNPATASTEYTISISEATEKIQLLDKKYIADYLVGEKTEGKEFVYEDKTYTGGAGSEIFNSPANKAIGSYSHAEGADTVALGDNSHAEGLFTKALADDSHAEGNGTYAEGNSSHAEGYYTQTFGMGSHSEGIHTIASGDYSHAEGENTVANSQSSHVQGRFNVLDSLPKYTYSYFISNVQHNGEENVYILNNTPILNAEVGTFDAEITETQVKNLKTNDLVIFSNQKPFNTYYNITEVQSDDNSQYQLALTGITTQINRGLGTYAHIVGNGTSEENRSNAHTLDWNGNAWYSGTIKVGGNSYDDGVEVALKSDIANIDFSKYELKEDAQVKYDTIVSAKADWNQNNESELDYIKNRPFYAGDPELTEVFNGNISFNNHASFISHFSLLEGEKYQVIWNNQEYFCTCQKSTIGANQFLCIGNTSLAATDSTQWIDGEPFLIQDGGFATIVNTSDDNSSCSAIVNIYKEYVKLLDRKFVSYMAGENVEGKTVTYNNQTYTCPTGAEIFNSPTNKAIGLYSHAEGHGTVAYGAWCHAEGTDTYASGNGSHAEGQSTIADGFGSHAEGANTKASGDYIHVEGYNTIASSNYQHVQGKHNIEDAEDKYAHIVGNGTESTPSNAHTIDWDGNAWFSGDVYVGGDNQDNGDKLITETALDTKLENLVTGGITVSKAESAEKDGSGNVIASTYETKTDAAAKLEEAKVYTDTVASGKSDTDHNHDDKYDAKNSASTALESAKAYSDTNLDAAKSYTDEKISDLLDGADDKTLDSIKELADAIKENDSAIEALNAIASGKADSEHEHAIDDVTGLQDALNSKAGLEHGTHVTYSSADPVMDGTASAGTESTVARSDHKHPTDTSRASKAEFDTHASDTTLHITSDERTDWNAAKTHADSAHAPSNAQENVIENIKVNGTAQSISSKSVDITVPTKASDIGAAESTHGHTISEITDLQTTLNNTANAIRLNTESINDHTEIIKSNTNRIIALEDGFIEITSAEIQALFA